MDLSNKALSITTCENRLGEEPVWHSGMQTLYWVDTIAPGEIFAFHPQSQNVKSWQFDHPVLALSLHSNGNLLIADCKTIWHWSPTTEAKKSVAIVEEDMPENRINCMAVDPLGNLWVATMQNNVTDEGKPKDITGYFGSLYRISENGLPVKIVDGFACPNTMLWSSSGRSFYFGDSGTGWIYSYACDLETGSITKRKDFFRSDENGIPDGSAIDAHGHIWNARWGAGCLLRISPTGELVEKVTVGAAQPTCCEFGGPDNTTLYITSARWNMDGAQIGQGDGALFAYQTDVRGGDTYGYKG